MLAEAALEIVADELLPGDDASPPPVAPGHPGATDRCVLRLEGEFWTVVYAGRDVRIRDCVGVRHLAQLLRHPEREFRAVDLMQALAMAGGSRGGRPARSSAPEIDAQAALAYRHRVLELQEELTEAEARGDLGRVGSIRRDIETLLRELRSGVQGRRMRADAERARLAVTKGIKAALEQMRGVHDLLAGHLDAAVKRGYVCVYRPDPRCPNHWEW